MINQGPAEEEEDEEKAQAFEILGFVQTLCIHSTNEKVGDHPPNRVKHVGVELRVTHGIGVL